MPQSQSCPQILQPLAVSELEKLTNLPSINYTNQDFFSMKTRLVSFIKEKFPDDFADFVESDLGIMLIENWAFLADTLSFKMDQIVNEIFIDTVSEIENAFRLCRLVGFNPTPPIGAKAMFSATVPSVLPTNLIIDPGLALEVPSEGRTITFELYPADSLNNPIFDEDIIIPAGALSNTSIVGIEGNTIVDTFVSNGTINQTFSTSSISVLYDSVIVEVDGTKWEQIPYFTDSQPRNEYRIEFDSEYRAYIIFGNGKAGRVPTSGSDIAITHRVGGGTIGNIITGFLQAQRGFGVPGLGFSVPVTFTNYTKGQFGYAGDTIDDVRRKLGAYIKAQDRAVTGEDYKILADQFASVFNGQVGKSVAVLRNHGCAGNIVDLFVLAKDGVDGLITPSDQLKAELSAYIDEKKMLTDYVCIRDGVIVLVDVMIDVTIDKFYKKFQQEIRNKIIERINSFFALINWEYGKSLKSNEVIKAFSDLKEVTSADVSFVTDDIDGDETLVVTDYFQIIRMDNLNINMTFS